MDKRERGNLGLSRRSVEQLERVIDTADTLLYPAHLMIGGWRLLGAVVIITIIPICQGIGWLHSSLYDCRVDQHRVGGFLEDGQISAYDNLRRTVSAGPGVSPAPTYDPLLYRTAHYPLGADFWNAPEARSHHCGRDDFARAQPG